VKARPYHCTCECCVACKENQGMDIKEATNEALLAECVSRKLLSASSAVRMLKLSVRDLQMEADLWILSNPSLFASMEAMAARFAKQRRKFGAKLLAEEARWGRSSKSKTSGFKINNYLVPYLARRMVERNPKLAPYVKMRNRP